MPTIFNYLIDIVDVDIFTELPSSVAVDIPKDIPRQHTKLGCIALLCEKCYIGKKPYGHFYTNRDRTSSSARIEFECLLQRRGRRQFTFEL